MTVYYLDTSALVKRYVDEIGSEWLREVAAPESRSLLFISRLAIVELISALSRRLREGALTPEEFASARDAFRGDCLSEYQVMPPTMTVIDLACALVERHSLRAYDATHLGTALGAHRFLQAAGRAPLIFLSSDERLVRAAGSEGLQVDNPNLHP